MDDATDTPDDDDAGADAGAGDLRIHFGVLGALVLVYLVFAVVVFSRPPRPLDFSRPVVVFWAIPLCGYALVTSVALRLARRRRAAIVIHAVALAVSGVIIGVGRAIEIADEAERAAAFASPAIVGD